MEGDATFFSRSTLHGLRNGGISGIKLWRRDQQGRQRREGSEREERLGSASDSTVSDVPRVWCVEDAMDRLAARNVDYSRALVVNIIVERAIATSNRHLDIVGSFS